MWLSRRIIDKHQVSCNLSLVSNCILLLLYMHKGRMGVTSAGEGMGSTFYFEIPLYMMSDDIDSSGVTRRKSIRSILPSEEVFVNTQNLPQEWASLSVKNDDAQKELYSTNHNGPQLTDCISESIRMRIIL